MSWISDVRVELKELDTSPGSLRKFGLLVGGIFVVLAIFLFWRGHSPVFTYVFGVIGAILLLAGAFCPRGLRPVYKVWMGMALAMGWLVSRVLLVLLFYIIMTTIGLIGRLFRKEFLDVRFKDGRDSYWLKRDTGKRVNYEKMY